MEVEHNSQSQIGQLHINQAPELPVGEGKPKTYHTRVPGSTFVNRLGEATHFNGDGHLTTTDLGLQYELDKISDKPGSTVYTKDKPTLTDSDFAPTEDIKSTAARASEAIKRLQEKNAS